MTKRDKFLRKGLTKLFKAVGRRFTLEDVGEPDWFYQSSWTSAQEQRYREWFKKQAMRDLGWSARTAGKEAAWFVFFYGWKIQDTGVRPRRKRFG